MTFLIRAFEIDSFLHRGFLTLTSEVCSAFLRLEITMCPAAPPIVSMPDRGHRITCRQSIIILKMKLELKPFELKLRFEAKESY